MQARKLGIDYGDKRIGVAVSDTLGITAKGTTTIYWNGEDMNKPAEKVKLLCEEYGADTIVVGLPKRTDGKSSTSGEKAILFAGLISEMVSAQVILRDERFTSVMANRVLRETGNTKNRKSGVTDQMAAEIILAEYLEYIRLQRDK